MRLLIVTPALPHAGATNAGSLVTYEQVRLLASRHEVTIATFAVPDAAERAGVESLEGMGIDVHPVWRPRYGGLRLWKRRVEVLRYGLRSWLGWLLGRFPRMVVHSREPEMQALLTNLLAERSFELLQVEDSMMASYAYPTRAPKLLIDHEVRVGDGRSHTPSEAHRWRRYLRDIGKRFDGIQVFSNRDAEALGALDVSLSPKVRVNPFGVRIPPEQFAHQEHSDLVFVGGFNHPPNVDAARWLVGEVMPHVWKRRSDTLLTIVGKEPPADVRALESALVRITGQVPAVEPYVAGAAVVVAPIRTGGGMRMKVLQAMAAGKAVMTTSLGAEGLAGPKDDLPLVISDEAAALASETVRLLSDPQARDELGRRAREFVVEHHTWEAYVERLEEIYDDLLVAPYKAS